HGHVKAQRHEAAAVDHGPVGRGAKGIRVVHEQESVVDGGQTRVGIGGIESEFTHTVLCKASCAVQHGGNAQVRGEEMAGDVDDGIAQHAHASADDRLRIGVAVHRDVPGGKNAACRPRGGVATVEDEVAHVLAKAVQVKQARGVDGDIGVIRKL